jgi:N-acylneuraminate cytidylyltransferase
MKNVAIITARGGSKRIPQKNIKEFCGKPIIAYSIEAAVNSGVFDEVMVSTDSMIIAETGKRFGASVPFMRSKANSDDFAKTDDVIKEVIDSYKEKGIDFDRVACIYPTAPFVTAEKLRNAMQILDESGADSLMSVVKFGFPPQRALVVRDGKVEYQNPEYAASRSQDLEPLYHDCGQFYICGVKAFLEEGSLVTRNTVPFIVPEEETQDIDTNSDWIIAEAKYRSVIQK